MYVVIGLSMVICALCGVICWERGSYGWAVFWGAIGIGALVLGAYL